MGEDLLIEEPNLEGRDLESESGASELDTVADGLSPCTDLEDQDVIPPETEDAVEDHDVFLLECDTTSTKHMEGETTTSRELTEDCTLGSQVNDQIHGSLALEECAVAGKNSAAITCGEEEETLSWVSSDTEVQGARVPQWASRLKKTVKPPECFM